MTGCAIRFPGLGPDDYQGLPTSGLFQALLDLEKEGTAPDFGNLSARTADDPVATELIPMLLMGDPAADEQDRNARLLAARRCVDTLRAMKVDRRINELQAELNTAERNGETDRLPQLVSELMQLNRQRVATQRRLTEQGYLEMELLKLGQICRLGRWVYPASSKASTAKGR
jgi:hypothetical protein